MIRSNGQSPDIRLLCFPRRHLVSLSFSLLLCCPSDPELIVGRPNFRCRYNKCSRAAAAAAAAPLGRGDSQSTLDIPHSSPKKPSVRHYHYHHQIQLYIYFKYNRQQEEEYNQRSTNIPGGMFFFQRIFFESYASSVTILSFGFERDE